MGDGATDKAANSGQRTKVSRQEQQTGSRLSTAIHMRTHLSGTLQTDEENHVLLPARRVLFWNSGVQDGNQLFEDGFVDHTLDFQARADFLQVHALLDIGPESGNESDVDVGAEQGRGYVFQNFIEQGRVYVGLGRL
jgi:hypothetical protein